MTARRSPAAACCPSIGIVTFVAFGLLMPLTGFEIPALLLCVIWLRFLGGESWRNTVVISVVTVRRSTSCSSTGCGSRCPT